MSQPALTIETVGDGPPVLLLHAFPYSRAMWAPQRSLADRYTLLLADLPGFGDSPLPAGGWTVDSAADQLASQIDRPVVAVGLSMGGYVALALARRHPDKLRGLVLADTRAEPDSDEAKAGRAKAVERARTAGVAAVVEDGLPKQLSEYSRSHRPEVVEQVRQIGSAQSVEAVVAALTALRDRPDARPGLADISVPTLVLVGQDDAITPPSAAQVLRDSIPGARLEVLPTAGHLSNLECPAEFTTAVRGLIHVV